MARVRTDKSLLIILLFLGNCFAADAQKFFFEVNFDGFFDNREYKGPYQRSQTFFGTRLTPEIGVELYGKHQLKGGVSWMREFGSVDDGFVDWTIYYRYNGDKFKANFGSFSRDYLANEYPYAMASEEFLYFTPNIQGALFQYYLPKGNVELLIDWRGRQSKEQREKFTIASSGNFKKTWFGGGWFLWLNHYAQRAGARDESVVDNILINPYLMADFRGRTVFDEMNLKVGALASFDRDRADDEWQVPLGVLAEAKLEWRFLGLKETFYAGNKGQLTFYNRYGADLHNGDGFYRASTYSRTDIYAYIIKKSFVNAKASFNVHVADGIVSTQQMLTVQFDINQDDLFKRNKRKRRDWQKR